MISIVICSRKPDISSLLKENIRNTIGVDFEIIVIDNSQNEYSIFSAYNEGVRRSKYPYLCFVHEDILFRTDDWGQNLVVHLSDKKTGIVGVAGSKMMTRIPSSWSMIGSYMNIIQHKNKKNKHIKRPNDFLENKQAAGLLDGVLLSVRRELFDKIRFDENFKGFHGYDFDICAQSIVAGYTNYVIYDLLLEHFSFGNRTSEYYANMIQIYKKHERYLPLFACDILDESQVKVNALELILFGKLIRRMSINEFSTNTIIETAKHFAEILNNDKAKKELKNLRLKVFITKLFRKPQVLFSKPKL